VSWLYGRPTAAELVAAVADFLDNDVRSSTEGQVNFHARVAANVLRIVERELTDDSAAVGRPYSQLTSGRLPPSDPTRPIRFR